MRVVITGGAGFIGANLAASLQARSEVSEISLVDDLSTGYRSNIAELDVRLHEGTILDASLLKRVFVGADAIVHLAARPSVPRSIEDPMASHQVNATGTLQVLEAAREAGNVHVILASSSSVYGSNPTLPKSEDLRTQPMSPYAVSKQATEAYALAYGSCFGLPVLPFRFFNVFGPLQAAGHAYAAVIPAFLDAALRGEPLPRQGDGEQTRDFTFVGSVTAVIADAIVRRVTSPEPINLAFGSRRTLNELIAEIGRQLDTELTVEDLPTRPGDVRHSQADRSRLEGHFPAIEPVPFEVGLAETIAWFRSRA